MNNTNEHPNDLLLTEAEKKLDTQQKQQARDRIIPPEDFELNIALELANLIRIAYRDYELFDEYNLFDPESVAKARVDKTILAPNTVLYTNSLTSDQRIDKYKIKHPEQDQITEEEIKSELGENYYSYDVLTTFTRIGYEFKFNALYPPKPNVDKFGFIARRKLDDGSNLLFVVFRGTREFTEWWKNFQFKQIPFLKQSPKDISDVKVSLGFNQIYTDYRPGIFMNGDTSSNIFNKFIRDADADARKASEDKYPLPHSFHGDAMVKIVYETLKDIDLTNNKIYVTGHSLGGALATISALHISQFLELNLNGTSPLSLYTFASPRVGNPKFVAECQERFKAYRIFNRSDVVPRVPLKRFRSPFQNDSYKHVGGETDFDYNSSNFIISRIADNHNMSVTYCNALDLIES